MAFEIPQHLPRNALPQDVSSKILGKIDSAVVKDLDATLATSWVAELDESISATKTRIHDRIQEDLPEFRRQLETSKFVQTRLEVLNREVERLNGRISSPDGLLPTTLERLRVHATLAQQASDATAVADSFSHLVKCKEQYTSVKSLVQQGKLPESVAASVELQETCNNSPKALKNAAVLDDLKRKLQALKARIEEQLLDALSKIIVLQPSRLTVLSEVIVRGSEESITLKAILASLSPNSLQDYLSTFRKHFISFFVENVLQQPFAIRKETSANQLVLNLIPSSPVTEPQITRLQNLALIFDFVESNIFPYLPEPNAAFILSLSKPVTTSVLNLFLSPQLPPSFGLLPPFLDLVKHAVDFEEKYVTGLLGEDKRSRPLKEWSDNLASHYERQRRTVVLNNCRSLLKDTVSQTSTFQAEIEQPMDAVFPTAVNGDGSDAWGFDEQPTANENGDAGDEDSWGLDEDDAVTKDTIGQDVGGASQNDPAEDDTWGLDDDTTMQDLGDSWGFDDDIDPEPESRQTEPPNGVQNSEEALPSSRDGDAWGFDDDVGDGEAEQPLDDTNWDDPWGEPEPKPAPESAKTPKVAKRLEKLASKNKKPANGKADHSPPPPPTISLPPPSTQKASKRKLASKPVHVPKPAAIVTKVHSPVETYRVTERTRGIVRVVEDAIAEGKQLGGSNLFSKLGSSSTPGSTLFNTATSVVDLYQALHPVLLEKPLQSLEGALQFSNDCVYLATSIDTIIEDVSGQPSLKEQLLGCRRHIEVLGDSWLQDAVERECIRHKTILKEGAQRFTYTTDQDRYDECENAMNQVLRSIKDLARRIKPILCKTKYYQVLGRFVDAALTRVSRDILGLPDITEVESHRLSELCRIFNALEGLFSENPNQSSFVVAYVPSWLKFSYLSELLEASLADVTYLFEEGALVDFDTDELVNLVKALFADTPLRTNTINQLLMAGQSPSSS
ncbi:hypothetical protein FA15DRAFT_663862 [Coprinopsis marcescibilis]|uniref:ZW10 C-terminal helical domain-containing protein n=1 Tax=Coprinopsis marcescibilis TaxID=230819 RepID=A0A5C3LCK8_COPMA|nr:hypothetical protein FA15DRAFT_663862 [Coprinopsis marcescibilis]